MAEAKRKREGSVWPRPRRRVWLAVPLLIAGLLAIAYALVPQPWRDVVTSALGAALAWLATLGALVVALALGAVLLLAAVLFLLVPRRARPQSAATVNGIAPVSVYLDIENGQVPAVGVRKLMERIRAIAEGRATDLLFYGNAEPKSESYKQFWRHGFRPIDVPYKQLGKGTATNIADLGLALHAFERALFGPPSQTIVIISHDQGFLPLVYRLHALGHSVALWAREVQDSYKDAAKYLAGVTWMNLALSSVQELAAPVPAKAPVRKRTRPQTPAPAARPIWHASSATLSTVKLAIDATRDCVTDLEDKPNAASRLRAILGTVQEHILDRIGYIKFANASSRVECWLEHLGALGVLVGVAPRALPMLGPTAPDTAVALYEQFLREVVDAAEQVAGTGSRTIKLSDVCARVAGAAPPHVAPALAPLRALLAGGDTRGVQHARYFCQCARARGMLDFTDTQDPYIIRAAPRSASGAMPDPSDTAPPDSSMASGDADRAGTLPPA